MKRAGLLVGVLCTAQCHSPTYPMTLHTGAAPSAATLAWSDPVAGASSFSVSTDFQGTPWACTAPSGETLMPPVPFGIIPRTKAGVPWSCEGNIELFADREYHLLADGLPNEWTGVVRGVSVTPPPDTLVETSFEDGPCDFRCPVTVSGECDPNVGTFDPSTGARTGARACRVCATQGGFFGFGFRIGPYARGKHVLEAWVRAEGTTVAQSLSAEFRYQCQACWQNPPADAVVDEHMLALRAGWQAIGPVSTTYTRVHLETSLPSGVERNFAATIGATADTAGACIVIDDLRITRE